MAKKKKSVKPSDKPTKEERSEGKSSRTPTFPTKKPIRSSVKGSPKPRRDAKGRFVAKPLRDSKGRFVSPNPVERGFVDRAKRGPNKGQFTTPTFEVEGKRIAKPPKTGNFGIKERRARAERQGVDTKSFRSFDVKKKQWVNQKTGKVVSQSNALRTNRLLERNMILRRIAKLTDKPISKVRQELKGFKTEDLLGPYRGYNKNAGKARRGPPKEPTKPDKNAKPETKAKYKRDLKRYKAKLSRFNAAQRKLQKLGFLGGLNELQIY